jgi:hypothetical protein
VWRRVIQVCDVIAPQRHHKGEWSRKKGGKKKTKKAVKGIKGR